MGFHSGQGFHPAQSLIDVEEGVVPTPEKEGWRLVLLEVGTDLFEAIDMVPVVQDQCAVHFKAPGPRHDAPILQPAARVQARGNFGG
jgi:hypothetical protein